MLHIHPDFMHTRILTGMEEGTAKVKKDVQLSINDEVFFYYGEKYLAYVTNIDYSNKEHNTISFSVLGSEDNLAED